MDTPLTVTVLARCLEGFEARVIARIDGLSTRLNDICSHIRALGQRFDRLEAGYRAMVSGGGIKADRPEQ
jgi:hypothetical protein